MLGGSFQGEGGRACSLQRTVRMMFHVLFVSDSASWWSDRILLCIYIYIYL